MAAIYLDDVRLSFIWTETFLDLVAATPPEDAPMRFLGRSGTYSARFASLLPCGADDAVSTPWPNPAGHFFWQYYLESKRPGDITGEHAWKQLVPFRAPAPARLSAEWLRGAVTLEAFYYPCGVALVATARRAVRLMLHEAVKVAFDIRRKGAFDVEWDADNTNGPKSLTLVQAADRCLDALRRRALGKRRPPAARVVEPFTVVSVVRGEGVDPAKAVAEGGKIHRTLEAMASWKPAWKTEAPCRLAEAKVETRSGALAGDVLYGRPRGRVVWFPKLFRAASGDSHSLACYHRNLTFLSLQVESLGGLMSATAELLRGPTQLSAAHLECARRAAGILGRLYGGSKDVYRSWSPRKQMDQNSLVKPVNEVRDLFNMPVLS